MGVKVQGETAECHETPRRTRIGETDRQIAKNELVDLGRIWRDVPLFTKSKVLLFPEKYRGQAGRLSLCGNRRSLYISRINCRRLRRHAFVVEARMHRFFALAAQFFPMSGVVEQLP
jgi:hypothetical protein